MQTRWGFKLNEQLEIVSDWSGSRISGMAVRNMVDWSDPYVDALNLGMENMGQPKRI